MLTSLKVLLLRFIDSKPIIMSLWSVMRSRLLLELTVHLLSTCCISILISLVQLDLRRHSRVYIVPVSYSKI